MKRGGWLLIAILSCLAAEAAATRVWIVGDSIVRETSFALRKTLESANVPVETFISLGSGLTRPDLFDWHAKLREIVTNSRPELVVVMMGASDIQDMNENGRLLTRGAPAWDAEYARRLDVALEILLGGGVRQVFWVGLPDMRDPALNQFAHDLNRIVQTRVTARSSARFFASASLLSKQPGQFSAYLPGPDGMPILARSTDGKHLSLQGGAMLAQAVWTEIKPLLEKAAKP